MCKKIGVLGCLLIFCVPGCASPTRLSIGNVQLGMSPDQVFDAVGEPAARDERQHLRAWRYEYLNRLTEQGEYGCWNGYGEPVGNSTTCRTVCEHTTIWFNKDKVRSMTLYAVDSMEGCGIGSAPINWDQMPEHAGESGA